jgi:hypothetical protein
MPIALAPLYYLDNFRQLVDFVAARYWSLLSPGEQDFYQRFCAVPKTSQMLYIRLLSRRSDVFLARKLNYPEIDTIASAAEALAAVDLLQIQPELELEQLLPLFTKAEILNRLQLSALRSLSRPELEQHLCADRKPLAPGQLVTGETIYQVMDQVHFSTFKLCYFGNLRQDLTDYVLRDIGLFRYEDYALEQRQLLFTTRGQIERHLDYYRSCEQLDQALQGGADAIVALWRQLPAADEQDPVLTRRVERMANTLARQLERLHEPDLALAIYGQLQRPPARERSARILVANQEVDAGLELCRKMATNPLIEAERYFAEEFGYRQAKKHGRSWPAPRKYQAPRQQLELAQDACGVEMAVANHLASSGACFFVENSLVNGVLGLAIWDIVFAPVRGAFFNPFQYAPTDFHDPGFTARRKDLLSARLALLADPAQLRQIVMQRFADKHGISNPLVNWQGMSEPLLEIALKRIPVEHWLLMLRRLLGDLRHHRNGMPDLIHFPDAGGYQWVEVKGPGDRLQQNQQRWLAFFAEHTIPHQVIYVQWSNR